MRMRNSIQTATAVRGTSGSFQDLRQGVATNPVSTVDLSPPNQRFFGETGNLRVSPGFIIRSHQGQSMTTAQERLPSIIEAILAKFAASKHGDKSSH